MGTTGAGTGGGPKKQKNKKNAMLRQRTLDPAAATSSSQTEQDQQEQQHSSDSSNDHFASTAAASAPPGYRIISDPIATTPLSSGATFDGSAGLSKLQLRPSLDEYLEKYELNENYDNTNNNNNTSTSIGGGSAGAAPPTWESNKMASLTNNPRTTAAATSPGVNAGLQMLLSNSSTLAQADQNKNRDILNQLEDADGFVVDRDSMFDPTMHLPHAPQDWKGYEAATPLSEFLMQRIGVSGQPISTAEYMRHALTHPLYGYYTNSSNQNQALNDGGLGNDDDDDDWDGNEYDIDETETETTNSTTGTATTDAAGRSTIFGRGGDFVTAPELSSVFGHSLCVWFMTVWQQEPLGKPKDIQFVELGPGRGTLMADLLELAHSSKLMNFGQSIRTVHLVEASRELRREQQETIAKAVGHLVKLEFMDDDSKKNTTAGQKEADKPDEEDDNDKSPSFVNTIRIEWHDNFSSFQSKRDKSVPTMVIMQEFIDALPVHQFQKTDDGWRERMIDVVSADETNEAGESIPTTPSPTSSSENERQLIPRLRQVLAPNVTPAVELLLSSSYDQYDHFPEGTVVEICPDALFLIQDVAKVLEESQGAALIIDYGEEGTTDTLRAFSRHQQVPLTSRPGKVDVTADVDFFALKNCLSVDALKRNKDAPSSDDDAEGRSLPSSSIHAFGPVKQGEFLMKMGAGELTMNVIEKDETTEEQAQAFADALKYLVLPEHMGEKFKVLALSRKRDGLFGPAGIE